MWLYSKSKNNSYVVTSFTQFCLIFTSSFVLILNSYLSHLIIDRQYSTDSESENYKINFSFASQEGPRITLCFSLIVSSSDLISFSLIDVVILIYKIYHYGRNFRDIKNLNYSGTEVYFLMLQSLCTLLNLDWVVLTCSVQTFPPITYLIYKSKRSLIYFFQNCCP